MPSSYVGRSATTVSSGSASRRCYLTLSVYPAFRVRNRGDVLRALAIFATNRVDFGDAMIVASMERAQSTEIFSHDQDFDRFPHFTRHEP